MMDLKTIHGCRMHLSNKKYEITMETMKTWQCLINNSNNNNDNNLPPLPMYKPIIFFDDALIAKYSL